MGNRIGILFCAIGLSLAPFTAMGEGKGYAEAKPLL